MFRRDGRSIALLLTPLNAMFEHLGHNWHAGSLLIKLSGRRRILHSYASRKALVCNINHALFEGLAESANLESLIVVATGNLKHTFNIAMMFLIIVITSRHIINLSPHIPGTQAIHRY